MFKNVRDFEVERKRILVRCDFNVPLNDDGSISDDFRIRKTLPTIEHLVEKGAKVILLSHLGEPNGKKEDLLKLNRVGQRLQELLNKPVKKLDDCIGKTVEREIENLDGGEIILLENLRFYKGETENDLEFAKQLALLGDIFINDAFGDCHRSHASIVSLPKLLSHGIGLLVEKEIKHLTNVLENPAHPLVVLMGGAKVQEKAAFLEKMAGLADKVIVSGLIKMELHDKNITFPHMEKIFGPTEELDSFDIPEKAANMLAEEIVAAKTVVWNGPFGKFEEQQYRKGTVIIAKAVIASKAFSVVGGGETIEFLTKENLISKFSWVSTGGGAMLQFLSGAPLPGLEVLK